MTLQTEVLKTLLYYDIWSHPLTAEEIFTFLPMDSVTLEQFKAQFERERAVDLIGSSKGYYFLAGKMSAVDKRLRRMRHARWMWLMARLATHVIKRFPFVRAVFVSGDLSKNATHKKSDIDFFIVTEPNRLWIARTLLVVFKKLFLLNSKKFFCLNSFVASDNLTFDERNIYTATEIATLKPMYNSRMFFAYLKANEWIKTFFPNFDLRYLALPRCSNRISYLQRVLESPFRVFDASKLDVILMRMMERVWARRYPEFEERIRKRIFRCTRGESRAYVGNFQETILALYDARLQAYGLAPAPAFATSLEPAGG